jgi:mercuric ion transport protein
MDREQQEMNKGRLSGVNKCFKTGIWGSIVAAICCATPLLAIALASVGLATMVPYLDYVLLPALLVFLLLALYGWLKSRDQTAQQK